MIRQKTIFFNISKDNNYAIIIDDRQHEHRIVGDRAVQLYELINHYTEKEKK